MNQLSNRSQKLFFGKFAVITLIFQVGCQTFSKPVAHQRDISFQKYQDYVVIGKTELVDLPDLGLTHVEMKVDTGAQTSSMHAFDIEEFERDGEKYVRFKINPFRKSAQVSQFEVKLFDKRKVKGTCGKATMRPIIRSTIKLGHVVKQVEFTLSNRENMKYRFLLGRQAMEDHILVHPGEEFLLK